jgi:hypothetical protein
VWNQSRIFCSATFLKSKQLRGGRPVDEDNPSLSRWIKFVTCEHIPTQAKSGLEWATRL